jgi:hypothetical protein
MERPPLDTLYTKLPNIRKAIQAQRKQQTMKQWKTLTIGILLAIGALAALLENQLAAAGICAVPAACFVGLWCYRYQRDRKIIAKAYEQLHQSPKAKPTTPQAPKPSRVPEEYLASLDEAALTRFYTDHIRMGYRPETEEGFWVSTLDREAGTYIIGKPGYGKSAQIQNLVLQDIMNGKAVVVIDPHGDLVADIIARVPEPMLPKVHLLDMTDEEYAFGANLLAVGQHLTAVAQTQFIDRFIHVFETLWPEIASQQYLLRYLRACLITVLAAPCPNLEDVYRLLTDDNFRSGLLQHVTDQTVREFWQHQYDELTPSARMQRIAPLVGRLEAIQMARPILRDILNQRETTLDFREATIGGEVLLFRLPMHVLPQDARTLGTILVSILHAAIFSFADVPFEARPGLALYVDEVQNFVTPDFSSFFTEARKYRVSLVLAHQHRSQLPAYLQDATLTARNVLAFQVTPDDARELSAVFPNVVSSARPTEVEQKAIEYLLAKGSGNPQIDLIVETLLRPVQLMPKKNGLIEIVRPGVRGQVLLNAFLHVPAPNNPLVSDPFPVLNRLCHKAQQTSNADLFIPSGVVAGFANIGDFYGDLNWANKGKLLTSDVDYPPHLVVPTADGGTRFTRRPEHSGEWLYYCIWGLRQILTWLAEHPIGKTEHTGAQQVAQALSSLQQRTAFIRSNSEVGIIYTDDLPEPLTGAALTEREHGIRQQSYDKYYRPKAGIESEAHMETSPETETNTKPSRWEVI